MSVSMKYGRIDSSRDKTAGGGGGTSNIVSASATAQGLPAGLSPTASASFNTSTQNLALTFGIPKGDTGNTGPQGPQGPAGANGAGVPAGGSTGQFLRKKSGTNYDTEWVNGASAYSETVLFDADVTSNEAFSLSSALTNYKQLVIDMTWAISSTSTATAIHTLVTIPVSVITANGYGTNPCYNILGRTADGTSTARLYYNINFTSSTAGNIIISKTTYVARHLKIIGIKY